MNRRIKNLFIVLIMLCTLFFLQGCNMYGNSGYDEYIIESFNNSSETNSAKDDDVATTDSYRVKFSNTINCYFEDASSTLFCESMYIKFTTTILKDLEETNISAYINTLTGNIEVNKEFGHFLLIINSDGKLKIHDIDYSIEIEVNVKLIQ